MKTRYFATQPGGTLIVQQCSSLDCSFTAPVNGSNPGTGKHGGHQQRRDRHIDSYSVSLLDPILLEHIGYLTGHVQKVTEGEDRTDHSD